MNLNDFIKKGIVRMAEKDKSLAKSLIKTNSEDLEFLNNLKVTQKSARKIMSNYYDCLRAVIEAIASLEGIKSYSHEAFTYYLKENKKEEIISEKFDRFRKIRNGIEYYGKYISPEEVKEHKKEILRIIEILKKKYMDDGEELIEPQRKIIEILSRNPKTSKQELAQKIGISAIMIDKDIANLKKQGKLKRIGGRKDGCWKVKGVSNE